MTLTRDQIAEQLARTRLFAASSRPTWSASRRA